MEFLDANGVFDLDKLDSRDYPLFSGKFEETVDVPLLELIRKDKTKVTEYIPVLDDNSEYNNASKQSSPLFHPLAVKEMEKIIDNVYEGNINKVYYSGAKCGYGRRYGKYVGTYEDGTPKPVRYANQHPNPSLTTISKRIRNTLYQYLGYRDFDFEACHPSIIKQLGKMIGVATPNIDAWVKDKEPIVKLLSAYHSVDGYPELKKENIKKLVSAGLYGGGIGRWAKDIREGDLAWGISPKMVKKVGDKYDDRNKWRDEHPWYSNFKKEVKTIRGKLYERNPEFARRILEGTDKEEHEYEGSFFSYYLGVIENDCLYRAYEHFVNNGVVTPRKDTALAYDGHTSRLTEAYEGTDLDDILASCNEYVFEKTGFPMNMTEKGFDDITIIHHIITKREFLGESDDDEDDETEASENDEDDEMEASENDDDETEESNDIYKNPALSHPVYVAWKKNFEKVHMKIIETASFLYLTEDFEGGVKMCEYSKSNLITTRENESIFVMKVGEGKSPRAQKQVPIRLWFEDPDMRTYNRVTSLPFGDIKLPPKTYNTYKPSKFYGNEITFDDVRYNEKAVNTFLRHVKIVCNHEPKPSEFFLKWIASYIQTPQKKGIQICITGKQGTGKTSITDVIRALVGGNTLETSKPQIDVWGRFNLAMCGCSLVILSEVDKRNQVSFDGEIKKLITDKTMNIEPKNGKTFTIPSFHRFITVSNYADPVFTEDGDRRNLITQMSPELTEDEKYWDYFYNKDTGVMSEDGLLSIYSYLFYLDLTGFNPLPNKKQMKKIMTQHQAGLSENKPPLERFLMWFVVNMLNYRQDDLNDETIVASCRIKDKDMGADLRKKIEDNNTTGFVVVKALELYNDFLAWKQEGNRCEHVNDAPSLLNKLKVSVIGQKYNLDKKSVCPSFRRRGGNAFDTCWDIYSLRDMYIDNGIFDDDEALVINGNSTVNSPTLSQPSAEGGGLDDMQTLYDSIEKDAGGSDDESSGNDDNGEDGTDDYDDLVEEGIALRKIAEAKAELARLKAMKAKKKKEQKQASPLSTYGGIPLKDCP